MGISVKEISVNTFGRLVIESIFRKGRQQKLHQNEKKIVYIIYLDKEKRENRKILELDVMKSDWCWQKICGKLS